MNMLKMLEGMRSDTISVLSSCNQDNIGMQIDSYQNYLNELCKYNYLAYANIINNEPLTAWVVFNMMPDAPIKPLIKFSREDMLANIETYVPFLSKWLDYIISLYDVTCESIGRCDPIQFLSFIALPYYIKNRVDNAPDNNVFRYIFEDIYNALARNDYAYYIDMCLEVTRCLEISLEDSKEVI